MGFFKYIYSFFSKITEAKAENGDDKRKEHILNILLVSLIALFGVAGIISVIDLAVADAVSRSNDALSLWVLIAILVIFLSLYTLSRKGYFAIAAYIFIVLCFTLPVYMVYKWGVEVPAGLLFYVLVIVISGILISTRFAFKIALLASFSMVGIHYLHLNNIVHPNLYWKQNETMGMSETIIISIIFLIIATVSWLSNREIERSLSRLKISEAELKKEKDSLEVKVEEKTAELKKTHIEQVSQLYRFSEFGKLSSGLFHDLVNHLTAASLNMEQVKDINANGSKEVKAHFDKAVEAIKRMENFIIAVRKQIAKEETESMFSLLEEILSTIQVLGYKAKKLNVEINFLPTEDVITYGDSIKFSQIVLNLITNAIESYVGMSVSNKVNRVSVAVSAKDNLVILTVKDWGCGIDSNLGEKIFQPFFTTKGVGIGTGIGLSLTKNIVEQDFGGTIKFESNKNKGTTFVVTFQVAKK